jgi:transglutaminase-like putative cysteine protease
VSLPAPSHSEVPPAVTEPGAGADPDALRRRDVRTAERQIDAEIALGALVALLAATVYGRFYAGSGYLLTVAGAAVLPALVVALARRRGWPTGRGLAVALVLAAPYAIYTVYRSETSGGLPGAGAWRALAHGAGNGWAQMLSVGLPADARGDLLITPVLLTWLASALAAWLVVATTSPLAPLGPLVASFVIGLGLVAAGGGPAPALTAVLLGAALVLVLLRAGRLAAAGVERARVDGTPVARAHQPGADDGGRGGPTRAGRRRGGAGALALGAPVVIALALVSTLAATGLPVAHGDRFDPRDLRSVPLEIDHTLNPLVGLKSQLAADKPEALFTLQTSGLPKGADRIRVAVLDRYDGAQWTSSAEYRLAGRDLPADPYLIGHPDPAAVVRQRVTVSGLRGPFLPVIGRPVRVDATGVGFDAASGTLVSDSHALRGTSYEVVSRVGEQPIVARPVDLNGARPATDKVLDAYRTPPPDVPDPLRQLALRWAREAPDYPHELLALRDELLRYRYDEGNGAPPGHSFGALERMLLGDRSEQEGYAEQFAAAFALLARERGFATRIVVGYRLPKPSADGSYHITEAQAHAWPEVDIEGRGWVVVEPTDLAKIGARRDKADDEQDVPPEAPGDKGEKLDAQEPRVIVDDSATGAGGGVGLRQGAAAGGVLALLVLLAIPLASAGIKLARRSRRRRAPGSTARVVGAWRETVDRLTEHGQPVADAQTTIEVAREATARFNGAASSVGPLATMVAVAVYAPDEPSDATARQAWELEKTARRELGAAGGPGRWVLSLFDPRPLLRHRRRRRAAAPAPGTAAGGGNPDGDGAAAPYSPVP